MNTYTLVLKTPVKYRWKLRCILSYRKKIVAVRIGLKTQIFVKNLSFSYSSECNIFSPEICTIT
jgi:hypothetical protein